VVSTDITQQQQTSAATQSFSNKTLTASNNNTVEATSGPGASQLGWRNVLHNGDHRVTQRYGLASQPLTLNTVTAADDRWLVSVNGASCTFGVNQGATPFSQFAQYLTITGAVGTTNPSFTQRSEGLNTRHLAGKQCTLSGWVFQSSGSAQTLGINGYRANTNDNFTSVAPILDVGFVCTPSVIPNNTWTFVTAVGTFTISATTGIQMVINYTGSLGAGTSFAQTEMQLELGGVTPFDRRSYGTELGICQRYLPTWVVNSPNQRMAVGQCYSTINAIVSFSYPVTPRTVPTGVGFSTGVLNTFSILNAGAAGQVCTIALDSGCSQTSFSLNVTANTGTPLLAGNATILLSPSAGTLFGTGAEL
jgi:hypothetical protein